MQNTIARTLDSLLARAEAGDCDGFVDVIAADENQAAVEALLERRLLPRFQLQRIADGSEDALAAWLDGWTRDADNPHNRDWSIDADGCMRWDMGNAVPADLAVKLGHGAHLRDLEALLEACDADTRRSLAEYRANYRGPSAEDLLEMRAAFGEGEEVVNVLTGETFTV